MLFQVVKLSIVKWEIKIYVCSASVELQLDKVKSVTITKTERNFEWREFLTEPFSIKLILIDVEF